MAQMSFFQVGIGLSSSPLGLAAYIMEKVANTTIQIKPGNQIARWNQIPRQKYQNPHLQFSTWTNPSLTDAKDGGLSNLRIPKFVIILATLVVGGK